MKFSKLGWMGVALLGTVAMGTAALAQNASAQAPTPRQGGQGGRGGGFNAAPTLSNLPLPYLTWKLSLSDEQKTKIQAIQDKVRTDMQELRKPDASGQRPDRATMQAKTTELNNQAKKDIEAILTSDQIKKEAGALKTAENYNAIGIPLGVLPDLKLTQEEETKLNEIADAAVTADKATQKELTEARTSGDQQKMQDLRQTMQTARTANQAKALAVLTTEQKAVVTQYLKDHPAGNRGGNRPPNGA